MQKLNQDYFRNVQYKDGTNLQFRIDLYTLFSKNKYGLMKWIFDRFDIPKDSAVLEIGCGTGQLWADNLERIPMEWKIILSDFSQGMLNQSRKTLGERFSCQIIDAQMIPYPDESFDCVIANHMLYHVPDKMKALSEIHRVLKKSGTAFIATNGRGHLNEMRSLMREFSGKDLGDPLWGSFRVEDAKAVLEKIFSSVQLEWYDDSLEVTESRPLVDYVFSLDRIDYDLKEEFNHFVKGKMEESGGKITITKAIGLFTLRKN